MRKFLLVLSLGFVFACATPGPVLYPNAHLKKVGEEQARRDIAACEQLAQAYVESDEGKKVAMSTAAGAAGGAVVGGAVGAVTGHLGRGLGVGAAGGAAAGLVRGVAKASEPSPLYKRFVERCLRERGYEPLGWR
ncbi:MAG TPA: cell envelope biogenesis protein OmpA [Syntrophales bacterium]|nr:cell envelope biogenesis protein OmpA [Syntrophales bacterium]HOM06581.1 cell envelope biogenesis protein OmpA [Syntrophales bacterium]HON99636.1 cell envelope biogenesis protein OmpA [Syntrophales bacterium]HPC00693.1 cell envelope biogenesis protein OmpA [Syntrophales bacterium]HPQ06157.1 cell envelope biogenesis protein OmpA [Syntrophales bacterium]